MAVVLAALALLAGIGGSPQRTASITPRVSLTVTYWPDETKPATLERWTVTCAPRGGTLPTRRAACKRLDSLTAEAFAPLPTGMLCSMIYGGPQKAVVKGTIAGARVWSSFRRRNGCEIARWNRFSPWLIPAAPSAAP